MWNWIADMLSTPAGAIGELHVLFGLLTAIAFGVIAAKLGHVDLSPYAAIAGFILYVVMTIIRLMHRKRRRTSGWLR